MAEVKPGQTEAEQKAASDAAAAATAQQEAAAKAAADQQAAEAAEKAKVDQAAAEAAKVAENKFDPSKIDVNDPDVVGSLTDDEFRQLQEHLDKSPAAPAKVDKAEADKDKGTPAPAEMKYAGKFKDEDALVKGVEELSKKLELNPVLQATIEAAKRDKAFGTLEAVYKQLEVEQGRKASAPPKPILEPDKVAAAAPDTSEEKLLNAVAAMTYSDLSRSELAEEFAKEGLEMPKTSKEFDALKTSSPYLASEYKRLFTATFEDHLGKARKHIEAKSKVETDNKTVVDSDTQAVKSFAEANGIKLTDAEMKAVVDTTLAMSWAFDTKDGVKFLRPGVLQAVFMSNVLPTKLAEIRQSAILRGRQQTIEDITAGRNKEFVTASTAGPGGSRGRQTIAKPIDVNDPDQIHQMTDEELAAYNG